jgi:hypothetical protein
MMQVACKLACYTASADAWLGCRIELPYAVQMALPETGMRWLTLPGSNITPVRSVKVIAAPKQQGMQ